MSGITQKLSIGVATCAMAAAATLTTIPVAQAAPAFAPPPKVLGGTIVENDLWSVLPDSYWFQFLQDLRKGDAELEDWDPPSPSFSGSTTIFEFTVLESDLSGWPIVGWFAKKSLTVCTPHFSVKIGPYGGLSVGVGRGSCS